MRILAIVFATVGVACISHERTPADASDAADTASNETTADAETVAPRCKGATECDDGNPCTVDTCDGTGACQHAPASMATACDHAGTVAGCHPVLLYQPPAHCDGAGACIADDPQNCLARGPFGECQQAVCDDATGCGTGPVEDGTTCHIADNFADTCVGGEYYLTDTCAAGSCQDGYSEPCPVAYCKVATCQGSACATSDMGRDGSMVAPAPWSFIAYIRGADGKVALWTGKVAIKADGSWSGSAFASGAEDAPATISGSYCVSADGELSWQFTSNGGPGALTFRGLLSTQADLAAAWDEGGAAFMLMNRVVVTPVASIRGHAFRVLGYDPGDGTPAAFLGSLSVDASDVVTGHLVTSLGASEDVAGSVTVLSPVIVLRLKSGSNEQTWSAMNAGTTGVTWFIRQRPDSTQYEPSLLVAVDEPSGAASVPTFTGAFRFAALDFDREAFAFHGDTELASDHVMSLRQISATGPLWRMPLGANSLAFAADGSFVQSTVGVEMSTVVRAGQVGVWTDAAGGFFVDVEAAPINASDAPPVPQAPHFRFGFRPH